MKKCDGNHGGPPCEDPECWNDDLTEEDKAVLRFMLAFIHGGVEPKLFVKMKYAIGKVLGEI